MKQVKFLVLFSMLIYSVSLFAQVVPTEELPVDKLFEMLLGLVTSWKTMGTPVKITAIIFLLIATMKNSFARKYVWDKLGWAKILVAPVLSMIAFAVTISPFNLKTVVLALVFGAGASYLANVVKAIREIPGLGTVWVQVMDWIGNLLGKPVVK